jgi:predicted nucleic acid-binding protein
VKPRSLFDVNALVGLLWSVHSLHGKANSWYSRQSPQVLGCAFTELSFIRVSMADKTIGATFEDAESLLSTFIKDLGSHYEFVDRLPPAKVLRGSPIRNHKEVSDRYLCELAAAHKAHLATLDSGIVHPSATYIG